MRKSGERKKKFVLTASVSVMRFKSAYRVRKMWGKEGETRDKSSFLQARSQFRSLLPLFGLARMHYFFPNKIRQIFTTSWRCRSSSIPPAAVAVAAAGVVAGAVHRQRQRLRRLRSRRRSRRRRRRRRRRRFPCASAERWTCCEGSALTVFGQRSHQGLHRGSCKEKQEVIRTHF